MYIPVVHDLSSVSVRRAMQFSVRSREINRPTIGESTRVTRGTGYVTFSRHVRVLSLRYLSLSLSFSRTTRARLDNGSAA